MADCLAAGYTYCAIAALSFLGRLPNSKSSKDPDSKQKGKPGLTDIARTTRWLVSRQMSYQEEESDDEDDAEEGKEDPPASLEPPPETEDFVGFNGRCNKMVDTCYAFWVGASLDVSLEILIMSSTILTSPDVGPRHPTTYKRAISTKISVRTNPTQNRRIWQVSWKSSR